MLRSSTRGLAVVERQSRRLDCAKASIEIRPVFRDPEADLGPFDGRVGATIEHAVSIKAGYDGSGLSWPGWRMHLGKEACDRGRKMPNM
jgi:hypothetical protein